VCGNEYVSQGDIINPENEIFWSQLVT
jgi:hypothetical protein